MFPDDIYKFIMWWRFYSNVWTVYSYIKKTGYRFKLRSNVVLSTALYGNLIYLADNSVPHSWHGAAQGRLVQSQSIGQLPLECPTTSRAWLLAVLRPNAGRSSVHSSRIIALKTANEPVRIMNTRSLWCLPIPLKQPLFLLACIAPLCACFYIHSCNYWHMGVLIVHQC